MDLDIYSTIFRPLSDKGHYLVVASAFPATREEVPRRSYAMTATAPALEQAELKCRELATALESVLQKSGHVVRAIHTKHWQTPAATQLFSGGRPNR